MGIKKPQIRQAGSADALIDSSATGREFLLNYTIYIGMFKKKK